MDRLDDGKLIKATSWSTNDDITDAHISATIQQILTKFSAVVTLSNKGKLVNLGSFAHGYYVNQVHHTTIRWKVIYQNVLKNSAINIYFNLTLQSFPVRCQPSNATGSS